jgi:hypothetical protein
MSVRKPSWVIDGINLDRPNPARIYDYLLGGHHNFAADRAAAEKVLESLPSTRDAAVAHRAWLRRVINLLTAEGIDQFLDIGSGLPTMGNVHELARATIPQARVVYVDVDTVVIAHSSRLLKDDPLATVIEGDLRFPSAILAHEQVVDLLDFSRPVGLTITGVLYYVVDDELAYDVTRELIAALSPGSWVALTHILLEEPSRDDMERAIDDYKLAGNAKARTRQEIARFFQGLDLVDPGLVPAPLWRPEGPDDLMLDNPEGYLGLAGVGRKVS